MFSNALFSKERFLQVILTVVPLDVGKYAYTVYNPLCFVLCNDCSAIHSKKGQSPDYETFDEMTHLNVNKVVYKHL